MTAAPPHWLQPVIHAALNAVHPAHAVRAMLHPSDLAPARRIWLVGAGKAAVPMAQAAHALCDGRLAGGVLAVPQPPTVTLPGVRWVVGGHPVPSAGSVQAGEAMADLLAHTQPDDLVLALISGGGSALLELPQPGLTLADLQAVNRALLHSGAPIHAMNAIRARLSRLKAGGLARLAAPAPVLALILSDVVGNDLRVVASGPTLIDPNPLDPMEVVRAYNLALPPAALALMHTFLPPTPPSHVENRLVGSNAQALQAAARTLTHLGLTPQVVGDDWQGEANQRGADWARLARTLPPGTVAVVGGETTVTQPGDGVGGRNQEAALAAALALAGGPPAGVACLATDGVDGVTPEPVAGAWVTHTTTAQAAALGLSAQAHLRTHNSYPFFHALHQHIITGPTETNVNDMWLAWSGGQVVG